MMEAELYPTVFLIAKSGGRANPTGKEEKRIRERRQAIEKAEAAVARAEEEAASLEATLADPATYQDADKAARLAREYQQKKDEIDRLYQAWEALEAEE